MIGHGKRSLSHAGAWLNGRLASAPAAAAIMAKVRGVNMESPPVTTNQHAIVTRGMASHGRKLGIIRANWGRNNGGVRAPFRLFPPMMERRRRENERGRLQRQYSKISQDARCERPARDREGGASSARGRQAQGHRNASGARDGDPRWHRSRARDQRRDRAEVAALRAPAAGVSGTGVPKWNARTQNLERNPSGMRSNRPSHRSP